MANPQQRIEQLALLATRNCNKAEAIAEQAAKVAAMNPLSAAGHIRALVTDLTGLLSAMAVEQAATVAEIASLKKQLTGILPKGE